jgi:hypothetical protein
MAKLSESRIEAMALAVLKELRAADGVTVVSDGKAAAHIADRLRAEFGSDPELDRQVRARIGSLKRGVVEGSSEWDILYRQYSEELARRR